jgi:riboflavin-specific deaminase-like protein
MSLDGKIALPSGKQIKLSSIEDFKRVHELRNYSDAVLIGINTVLMDDPKLTVKPEFVPNAKNPIRIILDTQGRIPPTSKVLDGKAETIIVMGEEFKEKKNDFKSAEVIFCPTNNAGQIAIDKLLLILKARGIDNLLVEGGSTIIYNFLKNNFVDEMYVYLRHQIIGGSKTPTVAGGVGAKSIDDVITLKLISCENMVDGLLLKYKPE